MTKSLLLLGLLFSGAFGCANAQDALEPCSDYRPDYYAGVDLVIDSAIDDSAQLSVTMFPSFRPEYGVRIVGNIVYLARLKGSFWNSSNVFDEKAGRGYHDFSKPKIKARLSSAPLSPGLISRIAKIYVAAVSSRKENKRSVMDGVSYRFNTPANGCGEIASPSDGTRAHQLVDLVDQLAKHAQLSGSSSLKRSTQLIEQKVTALESQ